MARPPALMISLTTPQAISSPELPRGVISALEFSPDGGKLAIGLTNATTAGDVWDIDLGTSAVTRWTQSETGGLDPQVNVEPRILTTRSFDGLEVSGILYLPDPAKFPGKRPLIVDVHGGPEGQSTTGFAGAGNYILNELGIGVFLPNVRGSTGFGKTFVSLDNGPFKREDSVKDMAALIDAVRADQGLAGPALAVLVNGGHAVAVLLHAHQPGVGVEGDAAGRLRVGAAVGACVGAAVGAAVGAGVGAAVGAAVGAGVGARPAPPQPR